MDPRAELQILVAELNALAGEKWCEPWQEPLSFTLVFEEDRATLVVSTDNGGGPETSHPVEHTFEVAITASAAGELRTLARRFLPDPT